MENRNPEPESRTAVIDCNRVPFRGLFHDSAGEFIPRHHLDLYPTRLRERKSTEGGSSLRPFPLFVFLLSFSVLLAAGTAAVWAQGNVAIVAGDHVFIRRGPGTEFPPFATLDAGSTVEV